jgi:hypothetical protein
MVLLSEQERLYADELQILNDPGPYGVSSNQDWDTVKTSTFTLPKQLIVMVRAEFYTEPIGTASNGAGRITVDGAPVWGTGGMAMSTTIPSPDIYILLAAGSHTINFDLCQWAGSGHVDVHNLYIGQLNFNDKLGNNWDSGSVALGAGNWTTVLNQNITIPAARTTPLGTINRYSLFVYAVAKQPGGTRITHMKNPGDSMDGGKLNVGLWINGSQVSWAQKANDDADGSANNPSYGLGCADGVYISSVAPGQTLNIKVQIYVDGAKNGEVYLFAFLCPWITPMVDYSPVNLIFPQGSVFYAYLEPLYSDQTKSSKLGMTRFKSFGDSTDFYSVASGTGILQHSYTLDVVDVLSCVWIVSCSTAIVCISYIAVDAK